MSAKSTCGQCDDARRGSLSLGPSLGVVLERRKSLGKVRKRSLVVDPEDDAGDGESEAGEEEEDGRQRKTARLKRARKVIVRREQEDGGLNR